MTDYSEELREIFEAEYAAANGMKSLQVKFLRACTGGYRDPEIRAAWVVFQAEHCQGAHYRLPRPCTQAELQEILQYDHETGNLIWLEDRGVSPKSRAGMVAGHIRSSDGYRQIKIRNIGYGAHRLVWLHVYGTWPACIDHVDRDKTNNRVENLRPATTSLNAMNTAIHPKNTSGFRGVTWSRKSRRWQAQSAVNGRRCYLGLYETPEDAAAAYQAFVAENHRISTRLTAPVKRQVK